MGNATGCDHKAFLIHFFINPVNKAFHHTEIAVHHAALHAAHRIQS